MRRISKKLLIGIIAMLVLSATAFAALTFSLADDAGEETDTAVYAANGPVTVIDYIIENAISGDSTDPVYHVLELGSSDTPSDLQTLVSSGGFREYVINGNKSEGYTGVMPDTAAIEYIYYNATEGNLKKVNADGTTSDANDEEIVNAIQKADLCYLSNDPSGNGGAVFKKGNDITEAIKLALSAYATGQHKPLIIDSHNLTQRYIANTSKTMETIATDDFAGYGTSYSTYKWPDSQSAGQFFELTDMSAIFLPINGMTAKANTWKKLNDSTYVARVLTIQNGAADNALTTKMQENLDMSSELVNPTDSLDPSFDTTKTYVLNSGAVLEKAYIGRYGTPTAVKFESIDISNTSNLTDLGDSTKYDLGKYDFIVVESGTKSISFNGYDASRAALVSAMYGNVHVLYSGSLVNAAGGGGTSENTANNYKFVYDKVATATDTAKMDSVLICTRMKMSSYAKATTGRGVKDIADIINSGNFRAINGNDSDESSNVYTALEIEPCYPINTQLASIFADGSKSGGTAVKNMQDPQSEYKGKTLSFAENSKRNDWNFGSSTSQYGDGGFYYIRTNGVLDATSDEISYNGNTSLTDMLESGDFEGTLTQANAENITDYYNWTLSKAKIAHALGVSYDEVRVVHMSSAEFAASKGTLLDNYDMIYFGGDTSAVTSDSYLHSKKNGMNFYRMYRHNGDTYTYPAGVTGNTADTVGVLTGNDITDDKLKELKEYVSKGMPVIFDKAVTKSYNAGTDIDPESNMYDFLNFASGKTYADNNALWNFDNDYTIKLANMGGTYGKTYSGYVTVFAQDASTGYTGEKEDILGVRKTRRGVGEDADAFLTANLEDGVVCETQFGDLIQKHQRPRLAVTAMPMRYVEGNTKTWLNSTDLEFKYKVNGQSNAKATLIVDDDANGRFNEDDPHKDFNGGSGTYNLPADYFGVVYWKLIAEDPTTGCSASTTGVCKVKRVDQEKMVVDLLEIIPPMEDKENNKATLMFCTECQNTRGILHGNRNTTEGKYTHHVLSSLSSGLKDHGSNAFTETTTGTIGGVDYSKQGYANLTAKIAADPYNVFDSNTTDVSGVPVDAINKYTAYQVQNNNLGVHEHKFGIVKYDENLTIDSLTGVDDLSTNWFEEIKDDYIVNTTILTTDEYESLVSLVNSIYNGKSDADKEKLKKEFLERKAEYETYYKVMRQLINGHDDKDTYTDSKSKTHNYIQAADWAKLVAFLKNSPTDTTFPGLGLYDETDLQNFKTIGKSIEDYLLAKYNGRTSASIISSKNKCTEAEAQKEIDYETRKDIDYTERNYYDIYSLVPEISGDPVNSWYGGYSKLYQVWRNAKVLELYFKNQYVKYGLLASVNDTPTGNAVDGTKDNYINLKDSFSCVVLGAADDFNNDDINRAGCNALLDYIDDGGNLILFHDTLNAFGGTTEMTKYLAAAFGQDARHHEYYYSAFEQVKSNLSITLCGTTKNIVVDADVTELEMTAKKGKPSDLTVAAVGHYQDGSTKTTPGYVLPKNTAKAKLFIVIDHSGNLKSTSIKVTETGGNDAHEIELTPILCFDTPDEANVWHNNPWYKPQVDESWFNYAGTLHRVTLSVNGSEVTMPLYMLGDETFGQSNTPYIVSDPKVVSRYGAGFDVNTEINQKLSIKVTDEESGAGISGAAFAVKNSTNGDDVSGTTTSGEAEYTFSNMAAKSGAKPSVRVKTGYKSSEYFYSMDPLAGNTPNVSTLTTRAALRNQKDSGGNLVWPVKYTVLDKNLEDPEFYLHCDHDMRDGMHSGVRCVTDKTSQNNKGIITMYPFTIGSEMKISNTTAQSYALDIEDPNMTVYYSIAGGTQGTGSSMFASDPRNGQDNYFLYQYGAITYTGAGHSAITGIGRDNNDERRLFINIIVNSARKSTAGPDLILYDVDTDMSPDKDGNPVRLSNDYVQINSDSDAQYKYEIEDISDQVDFSFFPKMASGTQFKEVQIYFDINREGSNRETYQSDEDVLIFKSGRSKDVDSEILTRITTGRSADDPINRMGIYLDTPDPGLELDTANVPNLALKESYFDKSKTAYIVVSVYDNKSMSPATKTIKVVYKPELLELN